MRLARGGANHRIAILTSPRRLELGHVAQGAVDAPLRRRVRIRGDEESHELRSIELAPGLRPAEEKALLRGEAIDHRLRMRGQGSFHCSIGNRQTTEVADVLAERQLTLDVRCRIEYGVRVELLDDFL